MGRKKNKRPQKTSSKEGKTSSKTSAAAKASSGPSGGGGGVQKKEAAGERESGRGDEKGDGRGGMRLLIVGAVCMVLLGLTGAYFLWWRDGDGAGNNGNDGETGAGDSLAQPTAREPDPSPLLDPASLVIPGGLSGDRERLAREALGHHARAHSAFLGGRMAEFEASAVRAFACYERAGWLPEGIGSMHHTMLAHRFRNGGGAAALRDGLTWLERHPDSIEHHELVGILFHRSGRHVEAAKHLAKVAEAWPLSLRTQRQLASVHAASGDKDGGLAAVDRSLELLAFPDGAWRGHPEIEATLFTAMRVTSRFYDYERLAVVAEAMIGLKPGDAKAHMALGVALRHGGAYAKAEEHLRFYLEHAEAGSTKLPLIRHELALALMKQGKYREALDLLVRFLLDEPHHAKGNFQLGQCLSRLGRAAGAEQFIARSRSLAPSEREERRAVEMRSLGQEALAIRAEAKAHRLQSEFARAGAFFERHLSRVPGDHRARTYYIEHLVETMEVGKAEEQLGILGRALGQDQGDVMGWTAAVLVHRGELEQAARMFEKLCERDEMVPVWGVRLARLYLDRLDRPGDARRILERVLAAGPEATVRHLLARALLEDGEVAEAREILGSLSQVDREWEAEVAAIPWVRCRMAIPGADDVAAMEKLREELVSMDAGWRGRPDYFQAVAEWIERSGKPFSDSLSTVESALAARTARSEGEAAAYRRLAEGLAAGPGKSVEAFRDAALWWHKEGARDRAVHLVRLAIHGNRGVPATAERLWQLVRDWADEPGEVFLRAEAERHLAAAGIGSAPDWKTVVDRLLSD